LLLLFDIISALVSFPFKRRPYVHMSVRLSVIVIIIIIIINRLIMK